MALGITVIGAWVITPRAPAHALRRDGTPLLPAPYQIEGWIAPAGERYADRPVGAVGPWFLAIDLGAAEDRSVPAREGLEQMTFVAADASSVGALYDIRKICEYLCGDEGEECHYVALYSVSTPPGASFEPIAALPGAAEVAAFRDYRDATVDAALSPPEVWTERDARPEIWNRYIWGPDQPPAIQHWRSWDADTGTLTFETEYAPGQTYPVETRECSVRATGELTELACDGVSILIGDGTPLLVSYPDYNAAAAEVVSSFDAGERTYYLVRLGLKAQDVIGLVTEADGGWIGRFRARDYALLC